MIESVLPPACAASESFSREHEGDLFPGEEALVVLAVEQRRCEFAAGRTCARAALSQLGATAGPIGRDKSGAPLWPDGVVGSITHCAGYQAAAVAHRREIAGIGIDAEGHAALPDEIVSLVAMAEEQYQLEALARDKPDVHWGTVLFSAKEAIYKCWYPLTGRWLDFTEAEVLLHPMRKHFRAELLRSRLQLRGEAISRLEGRWDLSRGLIVTAVAVAAV